MSVSLGVVMDPIENINYKKDSTLAMLWAAQSKGWQLYYIQQHDLHLTGGSPRASMRRLKVSRNPANWFELADPEDHALNMLDVVLMRIDPPFDMEYVYTTYILEAAERLGTLIVNRPQSLRDCNEKMAATLFPECCPEHLVSADAALLKKFQKQYHDVIFKPLDGMGGTNIFRVRDGDPNQSVIIESLTNNGKNTIMAQRYIPEIVNGDKRILMIDSVPVPYALARVPAKGELRGNLAAGATGEARELSDRDYWICEQIGPFLKEKGLLFVGVDVIGDYLTEINVTSPTCIRELDAAHDLDIAGQLMDSIATRLAK